MAKKQKTPRAPKKARGEVLSLRELDDRAHADAYMARHAKQIRVARRKRAKLDKEQAERWKSNSTPENEIDLIRRLAVVFRERLEIETAEAATAYAAVDGDETAAREILEQFVELTSNRGIAPFGRLRSERLDALTCLIAVTRLIKRVLNVDMKDPANRKGALPAAIGLVSRASEFKRIRDRAIYVTFDRARYNTGVPGRSFEECAKLVSKAILESGALSVDETASLTKPTVEVIYRRMLDKY